MALRIWRRSTVDPRLLFATRLAELDCTRAKLTRVTTWAEELGETEAAQKFESLRVKLSETLLSLRQEDIELIRNSVREPSNEQAPLYNAMIAKIDEAQAVAERTLRDEHAFDLCIAYQKDHRLNIAAGLLLIVSDAFSTLTCGLCDNRGHYLVEQTGDAGAGPSSPRGRHWRSCGSQLFTI